MTAVHLASVMVERKADLMAMCWADSREKRRAALKGHSMVSDWAAYWAQWTAGCWASNLVGKMATMMAVLKAGKLDSRRAGSKDSHWVARKALMKVVCLAGCWDELWAAYSAFH